MNGETELFKVSATRNGIPCWKSVETGYESLMKFGGMKSDVLTVIGVWSVSCVALTFMYNSNVASPLLRGLRYGTPKYCVTDCEYPELCAIELLGLENARTSRTENTTRNTHLLFFIIRPRTCAYFEDFFSNSLSLKYSETSILTTSGTVAIFLIFRSSSRPAYISFVIATVTFSPSYSFFGIYLIPALDGISNLNIPYAIGYWMVIDGICQLEPSSDKSKEKKSA